MTQLHVSLCFSITCFPRMSPTKHILIICLQHKLGYSSKARQVRQSIFHDECHQKHIILRHAFNFSLVSDIIIITQATHGSKHTTWKMETTTLVKLSNQNVRLMRSARHLFVLHKTRGSITH